MKTVETTVYTFDELTPEAQEVAINTNRDFNTHDGWHEFIYEDATECARLMGIDIDKIYFSGFWSQGDGACFEGQYQYAKGSLKAIKEFAPADTELHTIAQTLMGIQKKYFYSIRAYVKHRGHYYHERCTEINIECENGYVSDTADNEVSEAFRDFMKWIYKRLETEYDALTSDEAVKEALIANEYDFNEDGSIA